MTTTATHTNRNSFIGNMKNLNKILGFLILLMVFGVTQLQAQNISFNRTGAAPDPSAMLDVNDTLGGVLIPRMTMTQRNNITSPAVGLLIYQTDNTPGFYYYSGSAWTAISSTPATSNLAQVLGAGNDANNDTIYNLNVLRMGQSSAVSDEKLTIKSNNQAWGLLNTTGDVGMGFWLYDSISATDKGAGQLGTYSNHKLDFFTNNSQASMTISTDGNVGIGQTTDLDNKFLVNSTTANTSGSYVGSKIKSAGTSTSGAEQIAFFSEILGGDGTNVAGYFTAENSSAGFNRGLISKGSNANENYGGEFIANSNGSNLGNAAIVATTNGQGTSYNYGIYSRASGNHSGANSGIYARADSANTNYGITGEATATPSGSNFAIGVRGLAVSTSDGINYGAYGQASGSSNINRGVVGVISGTVTTNDAGLYSIANGTGKNIAVYGRAISTNSGGTNYGLYTRALNADTNYAAYFEAGNVYINDKLGLGVEVPSTQFQIGPGNDVNLNSGDGMMMLGYESGQNMIFDENEIQARTGLAAGQLLLQPEGGEVQINGALGGGNNFMFTGGKMGIGNYSPTRSIDAYSSTGIAAIKLSGTGDTWSYSGIELGSGSTTNQWMMYHRKFTGEENALMFQYFNGSNYFTRLLIDSAGGISFNEAYTFPTADGTSGQVLSTDGAGNLSWASTSSGADNLGNHILTQNIETNNKYISNDGDDEGIYVYNNGNVGFGINLPREQVDINGKMIVRTSNLTGYPIVGSGYLFMAFDSTNNTALISSLNTPSTTPLNVVANNMTFRTGTNWNYASNPVVMHMDVSGNVGIGTSSPSYKLDVNGTFNANSINVNGAYTLPTSDGSNGQVLSTDGSGTTSWTTISGADNLGNHTATQNILLNGNYLSNDGGNEGLFVATDGKVAIGHNAPSYLLDFRSEGVDVDATLNLSNSNQSHTLLLFPGRQNDPNPFILWSKTDPLRFATDSSGFNEWMRISNDGKLGLGTTAPTAKLQVAADTSNSSFLFNGILVENSATGTSQNAIITARTNENGGTPAFALDVNNVGGFSIAMNQTDTALEFHNSPDPTSPIITISKYGKLAINGTPSSYYLDVNGATKVSSLNVNGAYTLPTTDGTLNQVLSTNGAGILSWATISGADNLGNHTATSNIILGTNFISLDGDNEGISLNSNGSVNITGATAGNVQLAMNGSLQTNGNGSGINFTNTQIQIIGNNSNTGDLRFRTGSADRMRLTTGGYLGIGTTTPVSMLDVAGRATIDTLSVNGAFILPSTDGSSGQFLTTDGSGNVTWGTPSTATPALIEDADQNTKIQTEESANEDIIRFDINGTETIKMDGRRLHIYNSGESVYLGESAGISDNSGTKQNVGIGLNALASGTSAAQNVAVGRNAARNISTGSANVAIGDQTMYSVGTGSGNVGIGHNVGVLNENASGNVLIGASADYFNTGGNNNVIIGNAAGAGNTTHTKSGNIRIGYNAGYSDTTDNKLYIENSSSATPLIYGDFTNDSLKIYGKLSIGNAFTFPTTDGTANQVLQTDGSGNLSWATSAGISGSGTSNKLARWTSSSTLADATIQDDGTTVGINSAPSAFRMLSTSTNSGTITTAVYGEHTLATSTSTRGVWGSSASTDINNAAGVYGSANNGAMAIYGQSGSSLANTIVISGYNSAGGTNQNFGVKGQTSSSNATSAGIYGFAFHGGNAVLAESNARVIQANAYGSRTSGYNAVEINNNASSTTASITRYGLNIQSTGSWTGAGAKNVGLLVNATGGTTNYSALFTGGNVGILNSTPTSALDVSGNIEVGDADAFYMGDPTTDGTWRIVRSGTALEFQRRESGTWVYKMQINP